MDRAQVQKLHELVEDYDFWTGPKLAQYGPTDVRVGSLDKTKIREFLTANQIPFEVLIEDLEALIQKERKMNAKADNATLDFEHHFGVSAVSHQP